MQPRKPIPLRATFAALTALLLVVLLWRTMLATPLSSAKTPHTPRPSGRRLELVVSDSAKTAAARVSSASLLKLFNETKAPERHACDVLLECVSDIAQHLVVMQGHSGVLLVTNGKGRVAAVTLPNEPGSNLEDVKRFGAVFDQLMDAAAGYKKPVFLHVSTHFEDLYGPVIDDPTHIQGRVLKQLMSRHPHLVLLHPSPRLFDTAKGTLGDGVVPIPPLDMVGNWQPFDVKIEWQRRRAAVAWRGVTSGQPRPGQNYTDTDRYRMVEALAVGSQVRFTDEVNPEVLGDVSIPGGWFGDQVPTEAMVNFGRVMLDVDGDQADGSGMRWKLASGSPVLRINSTKNHILWFYNKMVTGVHLLVANLDTDEVETRLQFLLQKDAISQMMGNTAVKFVEAFLSPTAIDKYIETMLADPIVAKSKARRVSWALRPIPSGYKLDFNSITRY